MKFRKEIVAMLREGRDFRVVDTDGAVIVNFARSGALIKRIAYRDSLANRLYVDSRPADLIADELIADLECAGLRKRDLSIQPWQNLRLTPSPALVAVPPAEEQRYYEAMIDYCRDRLARLNRLSGQDRRSPSA
jgi:hypothetical protein